MNAATAGALQRRLEADADADLVSLRTTTDVALSIGRDVWRLRWRGHPTTAVAADASLHTTCGALLDALALLETALSGAEATGARPALDLSIVNVLVDRPLPGDMASETDQALRSMRDATTGVEARIWYGRPEAGWVQDCNPAPTWPEGDPRVARWLRRFLVPRLRARPGQMALDLVAAVDDPSLHLYPSEVRTGRTDVWALRLDGLQIGTASTREATLTVGKPGTIIDGSQRRAFTEVFGRPLVTVSADALRPEGCLTVTEAAEGINALLRRFREADVRGAPITHRASGGVRIVDEHALEARLLKGLARLTDGDEGLVMDDTLVARGSQFPTLWGHRARPRYLDAMLRRGSTPIAVELKVATGGQGRYYRRSLVQAVLYRHFIRNAPGLDPWFEAASLDRLATESAIGVPIPARWTVAFERDRELLVRIAGRVGASVHVIDDRVTPDRVATEGLDAPGTHEYEGLTWRLASALSSRWPRSLGRAVELHDCGGFYDQIQLQGLADGALGTPSARPRVQLLRPGSVRVLSQSGSERWVWRDIWNHLAHGGDAGQAAVMIGAVAGLGHPEVAVRRSFAEVASALVEALPGAGWSWRCAWPDGGEVSSWVERYRRPLSRYSRASVRGALPTIARIWGAVRASEAAVIVDQLNLRVWAWSGRTVIEVIEVDPLRRIAASAKLIDESWRNSDP